MNTIIYTNGFRLSLTQYWTLLRLFFIYTIICSVFRSSKEYEVKSTINITVGLCLFLEPFLNYLGATISVALFKKYPGVLTDIEEGRKR